jgi:hypothetical protein
MATLIEPVWVLLNRILCVLQPLEELRTSKAPASRSLTVNYASSPPQLVAFKALRARHFLLAVICVMALLSNLLAISFAGLFHRGTIAIAQETIFRPPLHAQFVSIDGSAGPAPTDDGTMPGDFDSELSGAYQGGLGEDQVLVLESNYTRNTTLMPWLGKNAAYLPFKATAPGEQGHEFHAQTSYFTIVPNCKALTFGVDYILDLRPEEPVAYPEYFEVSLSRGDGPRMTCYVNTGTYILPLGCFPAPQYSSCQPGQFAAELVMALQAAPNATQSERETCMASAMVGWMRSSSCGESTGNGNFQWGDPGKEKAFFMLRQPQMEVGTAHIRVDADGVLLEEATNATPNPDQSVAAIAKYTTNGLENLIGHSNLFLFRSLGNLWHKGSYASENLHYFINRFRGDTQLTDPSTPIPAQSDVETINRAYKRLFATWIAVNLDLLFLPATNVTMPIQGFTHIQEERLEMVLQPYDAITL